MRVLVIMAALVAVSVVGSGCNDDTVLGLQDAMKPEAGSSTELADFGSSNACGVPAAPTNLRCVNVWANALDLRWNDNSTNEWEFRIAMSRNNGATWDNVGWTFPNETVFRVTGLQPGTNYLFKVRAANYNCGAQYSAYTNTISVRTR